MYQPNITNVANIIQTILLLGHVLGTAAITVLVAFVPFFSDIFLLVFSIDEELLGIVN